MKRNRQRKREAMDMGRLIYFTVVQKDDEKELDEQIGGLPTNGRADSGQSKKGRRKRSRMDGGTEGQRDRLTGAADRGTG